MVYDFFKRILDILGGLVGLIIFSPVMLAMAIAIKLNSPGPILADADTPMRVGKDGKLFKMHKFRSMFKGAFQALHHDPKWKKVLAEFKKNDYKLTFDPRITRVGRFIRKTSLDELPQFWNILKGDMSLVGPRAYYPFELEEQQQKYPESKEFVKIILSAKPGLTGLWQVSGRSNINFDKRVELDAQYVQRRSVLYDIYLIFKTVPAVLFGRGAV
jgi:lipopolysaccharide/colanic/teichoic acid biosynthesis glycosyltransferase